MDNKKNIRTYALIALGISALACVAAAVIALFIGLNAVGWFLPNNISTWKQGLWTSLLLVGLGISLYGVLMPDQVRRFLSGRQARYGSNSLILLLALVGILVMVNVLVYQSQFEPLDMTDNKANTLKPETLQMLENLPEKVTATAYFSTGSATSTADELLGKFKIKSKGNFDYSFQNPDSDPITVREAGIVGDGKILLRMGDRKEVASYADETELVRALNRLVNPGTRVVYFLTGHGEADIAASGETALSLARSTLENKNYTVNTLNLLAEKKIPADALAVVIAGPLKPLSANEVDLLKQFVANGGGLVAAEDPLPLTDFGASPDPLADYLRSDWGITLDDNMVIDLTNSGNELLAISMGLSPAHPITRGMSQVAIFPNARSLSLEAAPPQDVTATSLAQTAEQSWGETEYTTLEGTRVQYDEGLDKLGPLTLAAAGENPSTRGRVVVFGNSAFFLDANFEQYGNGDIFINAVDWAAAQENQITLTPYESTERSLKAVTMPVWLAILLFSVFVLPGLVVIAGGVNWFTRRRRG